MEMKTAAGPCFSPTTTVVISGGIQYTAKEYEDKKLREQTLEVLKQIAALLQTLANK